jgi:hypothetical protein
MISPKLLYFSPFFFLIFSPLETADFFMLLKPSGDGYSLLCIAKNSLRGTGQEAGQESVSATTLDPPGTYTSWLVYYDMKAR